MEVRPGRRRRATPSVRVAVLLVAAAASVHGMAREERVSWVVRVSVSVSVAAIVGDGRLELLVARQVGMGRGVGLLVFHSEGRVSPRRRCLWRRGIAPVARAVLRVVPSVIGMRGRGVVVGLLVRLRVLVGRLRSMLLLVVLMLVVLVLVEGLVAGVLRIRRRRRLVVLAGTRRRGERAEPRRRRRRSLRVRSGLAPSVVQIHLPRVREVLLRRRLLRLRLPVMFSVGLDSRRSWSGGCRRRWRCRCLVLVRLDGSHHVLWL